MQAVADRLGLHYMTVYRWIRTGRLAAAMDEGQWRIRPDDVPDGARTQGRVLARPSALVGGPGRTLGPEWAGRLARRLVAADEAGAWAVVDEAMAGGSSADRVLVDLVLPAMRVVGERWEVGELTVADEHCATVVARRLISRIGPHLRRRGRRRGRVVIGAAPGDTHDLAQAVMADLLRGQGFDVTDLGADPDVGSFVDRTILADDPVAVVVGAALRSHVPSARAVVARLRSTGLAVPVVFGGAGTEPADVADLEGVHHAAGPDDLVELVLALAEARRDRSAGVSGTQG